MALYSPNTAVVHSHDYMLSLQGDAENAGAVLSLNSTVVGGQGKVLTVEDENGEPFELAWIHSSMLPASARGTSQITTQATETPPPDIRYAKGSYFTLTGNFLSAISSYLWVKRWLQAAPSPLIPAARANSALIWSG